MQLQLDIEQVEGRAVVMLVGGGGLTTKPPPGRPISPHMRLRFTEESQAGAVQGQGMDQTRHGYGPPASHNISTEILLYLHFLL